MSARIIPFPTRNTTSATNGGGSVVEIAPYLGEQGLFDVEEPAELWLALADVLLGRVGVDIDTMPDTKDQITLIRAVYGEALCETLARAATLDLDDLPLARRLARQVIDEADQLLGDAV